MSQQRKRKNKKDYRDYRKEVTTYDPKIHVKTGSGYHMKRNAPIGDLSGAQLSHIFYKK
jgi:hypothetical protein